MKGLTILAGALFAVLAPSAVVAESKTDAYTAFEWGISLALKEKSSRGLSAVSKPKDKTIDVVYGTGENEIISDTTSKGRTVFLSGGSDSIFTKADTTIALRKDQFKEISTVSYTNINVKRGMEYTSDVSKYCIYPPAGFYSMGDVGAIKSLMKFNEKNPKSAVSPKGLAFMEQRFCPDFDSVLSRVEGMRGNPFRFAVIYYSEIKLYVSFYLPEATVSSNPASAGRYAKNALSLMDLLEVK